jgi:hypothetical protein
MAFFLFGKRKIRRSAKKTKKPPAALLRRCRKLKIKTTKKVGRSKRYRSASLLKKLIKRKMKKMKKVKKMKHRTHRRRGFSFGSAAFTNAGPANYGYNQPVVQTPGILSQSSQIVTQASNATRPMDLQVPPGTPDIYGVGRTFFTETVPTQYPPNWGFMGQPDGSMIPVGYPINGYKSPAFGMRRRRRRRQV